ncbi:MAG: ABC transporter permease [Candidatus Bathyarchaeota archaeon]
MRSNLWNLILKEIKELVRDPKILVGIIIMPLLTFPLLGFAINLSQKSVEEAAESMSVGVLDLDQGEASQNLTALLRSIPSIGVMEVNASSEEEGLERLKEINSTVFLVAPKGFSLNLTTGSMASLRIYVEVRSVSIAEAGKTATLDFVLGLYQQSLVEEAIIELGGNPEAVLYPINVSRFTIFRDNVVRADPEALFGMIMFQSVMFPMVIMILLIFSMQLAATSIAIEKEEKTLETLLSLPVGRLAVLTGKLTGSIIVAAVGALAYMIGFGYYMSSVMGGAVAEGIPTLDFQALGLVPSPEAYILLGITMFVTLISALALAISLATFTEDVRGAQSLMGYLYLPIIFPAILLMFTDITMLPLPLQILLYAIPYTHSMLATKAVFLGDYFTVLRSIAYVSLFTITVLYIAAKIFSTEKVITARISLKKLRKIFKR